MSKKKRLVKKRLVKKRLGVVRHAHPLLIERAYHAEQPLLTQAVDHIGHVLGSVYFLAICFLVVIACVVVFGIHSIPPQFAVLAFFLNLVMMVHNYQREVNRLLHENAYAQGQDARRAQDDGQHAILAVLQESNEHLEESNEHLVKIEDWLELIHKRTKNY